MLLECENETKEKGNDLSSEEEICESKSSCDELSDPSLDKRKKVRI